MQLIKQGSLTKPDVYKRTDAGQSWLIKTFTDKPSVIKYTYGWLVLWREYRYLRRLHGVLRIPGAASFADVTLTENFIEGTSFSQLYIEQRQLNPEIFIELYRILDDIHQRRVVHLDLRLSSNFILGDDQRPWIIDFNTCLYIPRIPMIGDRLLHLLKRIDYSGIIKLKYQFCPAAVTAAEQQLYERINRVRCLWPFTAAGERTIRIRK